MRRGVPELTRSCGADAGHRREPLLENALPLTLDLSLTLAFHTLECVREPVAEGGNCLIEAPGEVAFPLIPVLLYFTACGIDPTS